MQCSKIKKRILILLVSIILVARLAVFVMEALMGLDKIQSTIALLLFVIPLGYAISYWINEMVKAINKDELTGLYNRKQLEVMGDIMKKTRRMVIILIDIDNFKEINDKYGHSKGDEVLKTISIVLNNSIRDNDSVIRYGGDEFVIAYQTGISPKKFEQRISEKIKFASEAIGIPITYSRGISVFPRDGKTMDELIEVADKRMYIDKKRKDNDSSKENISDVVYLLESRKETML